MNDGIEGTIVDVDHHETVAVVDILVDTPRGPAHHYVVFDWRPFRNFAEDYDGEVVGLAVRVHGEQYVEVLD